MCRTRFFPHSTYDMCERAELRAITINVRVYACVREWVWTMCVHHVQAELSNSRSGVGVRRSDKVSVKVQCVCYTTLNVLVCEEALLPKTQLVLSLLFEVSTENVG